MKQLNLKQKERFGKTVKNLRKALIVLDEAFFPLCIAADYVITQEQKEIFFNAYEEIRKVIDEVDVKTR